MANYPKIFWGCSFPDDIVYVSLLSTYDPNTWFVKLRPECSHKMCVVSLHLTTQHRQVSMTSALRPENHLTYVSLISMNPRNEVLSCNHKIWVLFLLALPAPKQPPVSASSARWPHKKWFHSPQPCTLETICPSFPWPHGPKNVLDLLSLSLVSQILVGFAYFAQPGEPK